MDEITEKEYETTSDETPKPPANELLSEPLFTPEEITTIEQSLAQPIDAMKNLAAKLKIYTDHKIDREMAEKGYLTENTRGWVKEYNLLLEKLQKAQHGDKSVNLHLHEISHAHIASKMRKYKDVTPRKEAPEEE
jgi:hypothetical protein